MQNLPAARLQRKDGRAIAMNYLIKAIGAGFLTLGMVLWPMPALALTVEVTPVAGGFFFLFSEISPAAGTDPVFTLNRETGEVTFGDGVLGQRPPTGQGVVATYQSGTGAVGTRYPITVDFQPFLIPSRAFFEDDYGRLDLSLIIAGLETLAVQTQDDGVMVQEVRIIPLPASLCLVASGLVCLAALRKRTGGKISA
jgi:hypothetical protein